MLPTRFWELLAGSLLALLLIKRANSAWSNRLQATMPLVGMIIIVASLCLFDMEVPHPGFLILIPVMGTVLVICFTGGSDIITRLLSRRTMVYLGLISYTLYFWHYLIFAFGRIESLQPNVSDKIYWIFLTFVYSIASYHYIEKPMRSRDFSRKKFFGIIIPATLIVLLASFFGVAVGDGKPKKDNYLQNVIYNTMAEPVRINQFLCHSEDAAFGISESCVFNFAQTPDAPTLVLIGA